MKTGLIAPIALALCLSFGCGASKPAPKGTVVPPTRTQAAPPASEAEEPSANASESRTLRFSLSPDNRLILEHGSDIYLIDPGSLGVIVKIPSPDSSQFVCLVPQGNGDRFLLVYRSGRLSLRESGGALVANSKETLGDTTCTSTDPDLYHVSWNSNGSQFLTTFDRRRIHGDSPDGIWLWRASNGELVTTRLAEGLYERSQFLNHSSGVWAQSKSEFKVTDLQGNLLHWFQCKECVLSPDEKLIIINQNEPDQPTRMVELVNSREQWRNDGIRGHIWSPSMRWLLGTISSKEPVVIDARSGKIVARWFSDDNASGRGAVWFGDVLVETDEKKAAVWKPGLRAPRIETSFSAPDIALAHAGDRFLAANAIWNVGGGLLVRLENAAYCEVRHWSANDVHVSGHCEDGIVVWDSKTGKIVSRVAERAHYRMDMSWSRQGHHLLMQDQTKRLVRHTPREGTVIVTPHIENDNVTFSTEPFVESDP